jgi:cytochrome c oxidase subunit 3
MRLFSILAEKPWLPETAGTVPEWGQTAHTPAVNITVRVLLAIISVFFLLFFVTFISRSQYDDFLALAGEPWQPFTHSWRLWINTAVLLAASLAMQGAVRSLRRGGGARVLTLLAGGALLAIGFIILQVSVWQYLQSMGYGVASNSANSYFYILTGLHALHLTGGLLALSKVLVGLKGDKDLASAQPAIEACVLYWHYLFVLWLVLFFILTRTPETYAIIAAACGLG